MDAAELLDIIGARLRWDSPQDPPDLNYRLVALSTCRRLAQIWFRTRGCRFRVEGGGCTVCDYGTSDRVPPEVMIESVDTAISQVPFIPKTVVLSASGSFLDPWEVPIEARIGILQRVVQRVPTTHVVLETHANTVTYDTLASCVSVIGAERTQIEFGLESAEPTVLRYCLNKKVTLSAVQRALSVIASCPGVRVTANVLVGIPLLTADESVRSARSAVKWAFSHGVDNCVLFPVNLRSHTFADWLFSRRMWLAPSLWELVDVLATIPAADLDRVDVAWFAPYRHATPPPPGSIREPNTCSICYDRVVDLLTHYAEGVDRATARSALATFECECRRLRSTCEGDRRPLGIRLLAACEAATCELLGSQSWQVDRESVTAELTALKDPFANRHSDRRHERS